MEYLPLATDRLSQVSSLVAIAALAYFLGVFSTLVLYGKRYNLPPGPWAWPILGNLPSLKDPHNLHRQLQAWAKVYGPIYTLWLGNKPAMIVTGPDVVKEALVTKGSYFINRPRLISWEWFSGDYNTTSTAVGAKWTKMRRVLAQVLSPTVLSRYRDVRTSEFDKLVETIRTEAAKHTDRVMEPGRVLKVCMSQVMIRICFGDVLTDNPTVFEKLSYYAEGIISNSSVAYTGDYIPIARILPPVRYQEKKGEALRDETKHFLMPFLRQRKQLLEAGEEPKNCFVDNMLTMGEDDKLDDEAVLWNLMEFLTGGIDTTAETVHWALAHLAQHTEVQRRIYEEIVGVVGDEGHRVKEEDLEKLLYLQAFVKESMRYSMLGVLGLPHAPSQDMTLAGYDIPAKAQVIFHAGALAMDDRIWDKPDEFLPERFLKELTPTQKLAYIPFGAGRRICPGMELGELHICLLLAIFIQEFEWSSEKPGVPVDLSDEMNFNVMLKNKLRDYYGGLELKPSDGKIENLLRGCFCCKLLRSHYLVKSVNLNANFFLSTKLSIAGFLAGHKCELRKIIPVQTMASGHLTVFF